MVAAADGTATKKARSITAVTAAVANIIATKKVASTIAIVRKTNKINDMENLINELKLKVIDALNLEGMTPEDIADDAPLFGDEGLGLDSIDVLELIVFLEKNYGIRLANPQEGKKVFQSMAVMAEYVAKNRTK